MAKTKKKIRIASLRNAVVTLKKMPERTEVSPQALTILGIVKAKGGALSTEELVKAMQSKIKSVQPMARVWAFYRARLVGKGFISVATKKEAK